MVKLDHNVSEIVSNGSGFTPLAPGKYVADITSAVMKESKNNQKNSYIDLEIKTDRGRVWDKLNLWNETPKAVEIAKDKLDQIGHALGITRIKDTDEILNRRIGIEVRHKNGNAEIARYMNAKAVAETEAPLSSPPQTTSSPSHGTGVASPQQPSPSNSSEAPDDDISDWFK